MKLEDEGKLESILEEEKRTKPNHAQSLMPMQHLSRVSGWVQPKTWWIVPLSAPTDSVLTSSNLCLGFSDPQAWVPCRRSLAVPHEQHRMPGSYYPQDISQPLADKSQWVNDSPLCLWRRILKCIPHSPSEFPHGINHNYSQWWATCLLISSFFVSLTFPNPWLLLSGLLPKWNYLYTGKLLCPAVLGKAR